MLRTPLCLIILVMGVVLLAPTSAHAQTASENTLFSFGEYGNDGSGSDPGISMVQAYDGNYYGTTLLGPYGGGGGTIFSITPAGVYTTLYSFPCASLCADGDEPTALVAGGDGSFYGTTYEGGTFGGGTIFKFTPPSSLTVLYNFCSQAGCADGRGPYYPLIEGSDGNFYGSTLFGGDNSYCLQQDIGSGCGTIFQITPAGKYTVIYTLCTMQSCSAPVDGPMVEASDGNLYGTNSGIFKISSTGSFSILAQNPAGAGLVEGSNQTLYAMGGSFYNLTLNGALTTIASNTPDSVEGSIFLASDGNFYAPGQNYEGFIQISPTGQQKQLDYIDSEEQPIPSSFTQGSDGGLVGTSQNTSYIAEFAVSPALPAPVQVSLSQTSAEPGAPITLTWQTLNAFSSTMQQCYEFETAGGTATPLGLLQGKLSNKIYGGTIAITAGAAGVYTYAVTCGGVESGMATLRVAGAKAPSSTALQLPQSVMINSSVTLTARVYSQQSIGQITGNVTFASGSTPLGSVAVSPEGIAALTVTAANVPIGIYPLTATYSGDGNYMASNTTSSIQVDGYITETSLTTSESTLAQGQAVTLTATVERFEASGVPGGTVTFYAGTYVLGTAKLINGTAKFTEATNDTIPAGTYALTASYNGDPSDYSSTSSAVDVLLVSATATHISASPNPVPPDSTFTLTATVQQANGKGIPTGTVAVSVGNYSLGSPSLSNGTAVVNASDFSYAAGTYLVTATYSGDANNAASSATVNLVIQ
jgi:uncharacterized repeat protein (TIGR03803 family)